MIKTLTPEQEARISILLREGLSLCRSTRVFSPEEASSIIGTFYKDFLEKLPPPQIIITENLMEAYKLASSYGYTHQKADSIEKKILEPLVTIVRQFGNQVTDKVANLLWNPLKASSVYLVFCLRRLGIPLGVHGVPEYQITNFYLDILKIPPSEKILAWKATSILGSLYCLDNIAIVSKLPSEIHLNESNLLHNDSGPAISYNGTMEVFYLNGEDLSNSPEELRKIYPDPKDRLKRIDCPSYGEAFRNSLL